jgi:chromosome partitioning protein
MIISVANQKGGVGKTDVTVNLASYLAKLGRKVLVIDLDPQGNATTYLKKVKPRVTSCDLLLDDKITVDNAASETSVKNLHLIAGNPTLNIAQVHLMSDTGMQFKLKKKLAGARYDYIFIDTPPSLGMLTINALTASDGILVPLNAHYFSMDGVNKLLYAIKSLKKDINPKLAVKGYVITMMRPDSISLSTERKIRKLFGSKVFRTRIPYNPKLTNAPERHMPIMIHARNSPGSAAYRKLAEEFLDRHPT